jgi:hypothetical protein
VEARKLLDGAGYDANTLKVIRQAFDEACVMIALGAGSDALPDDYEMTAGSRSPGMRPCTRA